MNTLVEPLPVPSFMDDMYKEASKIEESVLIHVLKQYLQYDPSNDDYKKCNRIFRQGVLDKYDLMYDGILLGSIKKYIEGMTYRVDFTPNN